MFKLKKIGALSLAKVQTIFMAVFGLFVGLFYAILGLLISNLSADVQQEAGLAGAGELFTPWAILIMPIMYAIIGFVLGLICAWLYNLVAKLVGGIELELVK
jgi:hypothetical protein